MLISTCNSKIFAPSNSKQLRVLDLGCLEGGISINLAQAGMNVVGVDVEGHIRKCEFVSDQLNLNDKITWLIGDVNDASLWDSLGYFDVIICSVCFITLQIKTSTSWSKE